MKKLLIALAIAILSQEVAAEPSTTRLIVPYPPGGATDAVARAYAEVMRRSLNRIVIVENRPGAGGLVGAMSVAKNSPADGSVILLGNIAINVLAAYTYRKLPFDPVMDLAPVSLLAKFDLGFAVGPSIPARNLREFIAWAKANPGKSSFGSPAAGSLPHFFGLMLAQATGIELLHVPYKGTQQMTNDLLGGRLPSVATVAADLAPLHRAGHIRILATSGGERARSTPDVPTFRESGFPSIRGTSWWAVFAPAATPAEEIERLSRAVRDAGADAQVRKVVEGIGTELAVNTPEDMAKLLAAERERWAPVVKVSGFTAD
jgi:tripartite-type tricarboxylate transporter receptor subunit TctC